MNLKGKKILVTGGSGFIGSHLIEKCRKLEAKVDNFDLSDGHDIQDEKVLREFIKGKYDSIFHLAGFSGSVKSNLHQVETFKINTLATVNLMESIARHSPKTKLIISSSRLEYGKPLYLPVDENHPTNPTTIYGLSRLAATQMALVYCLHKNLNVTIFRTSNVYGPHKIQKFASYNIVNYFVDLALKDEDLTIYGDGRQLRDYLFIDDLTDVFIKAALSQITRGQIYNLGAGVGIKFKDMAELIIKKVGRGKLKFVKWPKEYALVETGSYITDLTKVRQDLGFSPKISFEEGVKRTIRDEL